MLPGLMNPFIVGGTAAPQVVATSGFATSATITGLQAGDLVVVFAWRNGSTTPPTIPSGWSANLGGTTNTGSPATSCVMVTRIATGTSLATGTFTNATFCYYLVVRPVHQSTPTGGANGGSGVNINNVMFGVTLAGPGTSIVVGFIAATAGEGHDWQVTDMTHIGSATSTWQIRAYKTPGPVSSFGNKTITNISASGAHISRTLEIRAAA